MASTKSKPGGGMGGGINTVDNPFPVASGGIGGGQRIIAGGIVFFTLVLFADIPATSQLAVAFAYLILLSAALTVGPVAFSRVSNVVGG